MQRHFRWLLFLYHFLEEKTDHENEKPNGYGGMSTLGRTAAAAIAVKGAECVKADGGTAGKSPIVQNLGYFEPKTPQGKKGRTAAAGTVQCSMPVKTSNVIPARPLRKCYDLWLDRH